MWAAKLFNYLLRGITMTDCNANIWKPQVQCENLFDGPDPDMTSEVAALIIGTDNPETEPGMAIGPKRIQSKSRYDTASTLYLNPYGGVVYIGGPGSSIYGWNQEVSPSGGYQRMLTLRDRFFPIFPVGISGTTFTLTTTYIGYKTKVTNAAGCAFTIDDAANSAYAVGEEAVFIATGAAGITGVTAVGSQTLIAPASGTAVPYGRTMSIQKIADNEWLYTGP